MALSTAARPRPVPGGEHPRAHIAALDGLRGLGGHRRPVLPRREAAGGFLGVDLFFALSGFLITSLLLAEVDLTGGFGLVAFWGRRFRRLLPAVLLLLVVVAAGHDRDRKRARTRRNLRRRSVGARLRRQLARHRRHSDYWASFELPRTFGHLWSLAIEEQFYLMWPMIVGLIAWRSRHVHRTVMAFCVAASVASLLWMIALFDTSDPTRVYIGTDTRASSLLLGALFADAPLRSAVLESPPDWVEAFTGVAAMVVVTIGLSWFLIDGPSSSWLFHGGLFAHSLLSAFWLRDARRGPTAAVSRWIGWGPLRCHRRAVVQPVPVALARLCAVVAAAHRHVGMVAAVPPVRCCVRRCSCVEDRRRGSSPVQGEVGTWPCRRRHTDWRDGGCRCVLGAGASTRNRTRRLLARSVGVDDRLPDQCSAPVHDCIQREHVDLGADVDRPREPGHTRRHDHVIAPVPTLLAPPLLAPTSRMLMTGDSVAFDEWPAVAAAMYAGKIAIGSYVSPGAGLLDTKYESSAEIDKVVADFQPDLVLYQGSLWDFGTADQQRAAYERFADYVISQGARLALITIPPLRSDQANLDQLGTLTGVMNEVAGNHPGDVVVLNTDSIWGPEFVEDFNGDKVPERKPDGVHMCPSGAAMYAIWSMDELQQRFEGFDSRAAVGVGDRRMGRGPSLHAADGYLRRAVVTGGHSQGGGCGAMP